MKYMAHSQLVALTLLLTLTSCVASVAETGKVLYVDSEVVDCIGVAPQKCLLIRTDEKTQWYDFYDQISGFHHEPGIRYKLLVKITKVNDPPADASSLLYELIEILEKTEVP
jgi:hypothetical protein